MAFQVYYLQERFTNDARRADEYYRGTLLKRRLIPCITVIHLKIDIAVAANAPHAMWLRK